MVNNTAYEHGARKLKEDTGPDPSDDFSQEAAENTLRYGFDDDWDVQRRMLVRIQ